MRAERLPQAGTSEDINAARIVGDAAKSIRKARGMRAADVAASMGIPTRTYARFEAGKGRISYARISSFAEATNSDPAAILCAVLLQSSAFAVRCMENKFAAVAMTTLREIDDELGDELAAINASAAIVAFEKLGKDLVSHAGREGPFTNAWMQERASKIAGATFLGDGKQAPSRK